MNGSGSTRIRPSASRLAPGVAVGGTVMGDGVGEGPVVDVAVAVADGEGVGVGSAGADGVGLTGSATRTTGPARGMISRTGDALSSASPVAAP
jgi:hypothetical protein